MKKLSPNDKCREKDGAIMSFISFIKKKGGQ